MSLKVWSRLGKNLELGGLRSKAGVITIIWAVCCCLAAVRCYRDASSIMSWELVTGTVVSEGAYTIEFKGFEIATRYRPEVSFSAKPTNSSLAAEITYKIKARFSTPNQPTVSSEMDVIHPRYVPAEAQLLEEVTSTMQGTGLFVLVSATLWWCILRCLYNDAKADVESEELAHLSEIASNQGKHSSGGVYNRELT